MKRYWFQIIFCAVYILLALTVVIWALTGTGRHLVYYTFQGNILCLILMMLDFRHAVTERPITRSLAIAEYAGTLAILTIGVVYCTLLSDITTEAFWTDFLSLSFHFILPILYTAYIFIFRRSEMPPLRKVFWCLVPPIAYIGFIHIRNAVLEINWYPYFFTDISKIGITGFLKWVGILFAGLMIIGSIVLLICNKTSSKEKRLW